MVKSAMDRIPLNDGFTIPVIGFGTSGIPNDQAEELVFMAIMRGYRLIDTAAMYGNEEGVGKGIQKAINAGISREDIFVVTKVWKSDMGYETALQAFEASYRRLGLDYLDLYLIHWPSPQEGLNLATWRALEEIKDSGRVRSIGVSNFSRGDLAEILKEGRVHPAVNQIEIHPEKMQADLDDYCYTNNIVTMAWSPLGRGKVSKEKRLIKIGEKYGKTPAQVALKWCVERGVVPIPKTSHDSRMKENLDIFDFDLTEEEIDAINSISSKNTSAAGHRDRITRNRRGSLR